MSKKIRQLPPGQRIEIQISGLNVPARFQTEFVGIVNNRWFIVMMPDSKKYGELRDGLYEGVPIVVRFVLENDNGEIVAFRTDIEYVLAHPTKMLFLDWPKSVESRVIRSGRRFDAFLPVTLDKLDETSVVGSQQGTMMDISESGCRVRFELEEETDEVAESTETKIQWAPSDKAKLQVHQKNREPVVLTAIIRQVHKKDRGLELGIQFSSQEKDRINSLFSGSLVDIDALSRSQ